MSIIHKLSEHVINQIKAGEVVERPASVVKELVENSLDAHSTEIFIYLMDGGRQLIRIEDNGVGMSPEDAILSLERHATSKLQTLEDLDEGIDTLGFRGEALPSIAAVSEFELLTRHQSQPLATCVRVKNGKVDLLQEEVRGIGTTISVRNLFQNVPARLKFLRSVATELSHIQDILFQLALVFNCVHFKLIHNGRELINYPPQGDHKKRFESLLQAEEKEFFFFSQTQNEFKIQGFLGFPEYAKPASRHFVTFVNGRQVKNRHIRQGVIQGYSTLLMRGFSPNAFIFLEVPHRFVDVNASPAKTEVRFIDSLQIEDFVATSVQKSLKLSLQSLASPLQAPSKQNDFYASEKKFYNNQESLKTTPTFSAVIPKSTPQFSKALNAYAKNDAILFESIKVNKKTPFDDSIYLGQYAFCYLIFQVKEDLWILDQHAFHERILFEEMIQSFTSSAIFKQPLIVPVVVNLSEAELELVKQELERIQRLGFEIEFLDSTAVALRSVPSILSILKSCEVFKNIIEHIVNCKDQWGESRGVEFSSLNVPEVYNLIFATMACHSAVRAGDALPSELVRTLLNRASDVDFYVHCPHGRPVIRKFTSQDVAHWFARI